MRGSFNCLVGISIIFFAAIVGCAHGSGNPTPGQDSSATTAFSAEELDGIREQLCEIYSRMPLTKEILIDHVKRPRIRPVVVHRCQQLIFEVDRGRASISITDRDIAEANKDRLKPGSEGVIGDTVVLWIEAGEPASLVVPDTYPDNGRAVFVRYYTECFDPNSEESYECEGTSPPMVIIPPVKRP